MRSRLRTLGWLRFVSTRTRSRRPRADLRALPPPTRIALKLLKHTDEIQPRQGPDVPPEAAMDPRLAAQRRDPAVGLPVRHADREVRGRARGRAGARRELPQLAAAVRVGRGRLQDQGLELQAEARNFHALWSLGLHPDGAVSS